MKNNIMIMGTLIGCFWYGQTLSIGEPTMRNLGTKTTAQIMAQRGTQAHIKQEFTQTASLQSSGLNFTSATFYNGLSVWTQVPDCSGATGPEQYILCTFGIVKSFDKTTGQPDGVLDIDLSSFFGTGASDPHIDYDRFSGRWFVCNSPFIPPTIGLIVAVSNESVIKPTTQWTFFDFALTQLSNDPNVSFNDYDQGALDENAYYNGSGFFDTDGNFIGSTLVVIQKSSIASGTPNVTFFPGLFPEVAGLTAEGFAAPANNYDCNPQFGYFIWTIYDQPDSISGNRIQLYRVLNAGTATPTLGPLVTINLNPADLTQTFAYGTIDTAVMAPHKGNLFVASGTAGEIQTTLGNISIPHVRDHQLYVAVEVQLDANGNADPINGDRAGIRWYQFDLTGDPTGKGLGIETASTVPVLIQFGTLFDNSPAEPLFYYNGSIMTNKNHDLVINFTSSGVNAFANAGYAIRSASDPKGTLRTPVLVTNSQFPFNFGPFQTLFPGPLVQRWGDFSSVFTDPDNDLDFWLTQEFAAVQNSFGVQTTSIPPL